MGVEIRPFFIPGFGQASLKAGFDDVLLGQSFLTELELFSLDLTLVPSIRRDTYNPPAFPTPAAKDKTLRSYLEETRAWWGLDPA